jgi:hypothetical protein
MRKPIGFCRQSAPCYAAPSSNNGDEGRPRARRSIIQNDGGTKLIANNILLNSFSYSIHAYTQPARSIAS